MKAELTVVGVTEAGVDGLCTRARAAISSADAVFGGARHLELVEALIGSAECIPWTQPLHDSFTRIDAIESGQVVVLASGEPLWHGIARTLIARYGVDAVRVLPNTGVFSLAAGTLGWALEHTHCRSLHGHDVDLLPVWCFPGARLLLLTSGAGAPRKIAEKLLSVGLNQAGIRVLEHLGGDRELIGDRLSPDRVEDSYSALNLVAVDLPDDLSTPALGVAPGLADDAFQHDGQLTKRSVRAATLARLRPVAGQCLWDLGAGCGSVAIEWTRLALTQAAGTPASGTVLAYAVERSADRVAMIEHNRRALGTPHVAVLPESVESALANLPQPHAVFIGGGLTQWRSDAVGDATFEGCALIAHCLERLAPGGRLVANAVTLESEAVLLAAVARFGGELERLMVSHSQSVGRYTALQPAMTVLQYAVERPLR